MKFTSVIKVATALLAASSVDAYESLKSRAGNFRIGVAVDNNRFNNQSYMNALKNFNYMVAENGCKMSYIQPQRGKYNFNACDAHYNKAKELGMAFRGHCLIWHSMPPSWFQNLSASDMKTVIVDHITKTLQHYEGKIDTWDVVNEAIDDSSSGTNWKYRNSFIYQKVPNFVELAFQTARKVSPNTKLFYNDYNTEALYPKSEAVYNFLKQMKSKGVPIDGVGLQYHVSITGYPKYDNIKNLIGRYCQLGLEVHITEMDVVSNGNADKQATVYSEALKACLSNSCCKAFLVWGIGDNDSWLGASKTGLIFNSSYQPKAAYNALLNTLGSSGNTGGGNNNNNNNNKTTTKKTTARAQTTTKASSGGNTGNCVGLYAQCGGKGYKGSTTCCEGTCVANGEYYSQCVPGNNGSGNGNNNNNNNNKTTTKKTTTKAATTTKASGGSSSGSCASQWAQCGGSGYNGPTKCCKGTCQKLNQYYSQCV